MAGDAAMQPAESAITLSGLAGLMDEATEEQEEIEEQEVPDVAEEEPEESEHEETEEERKEDEEEPTFVIKHDGKEISLKQSELIAQAQQGYDYSKKTMALAEDRKAVEASRAQADELRQHNETALRATLDRLNAFMKYAEAQVGNEPDISLAQQDPSLYLAQKKVYDDRKGQLQRAHEAIGQVNQEQQRIRQAHLLEEAEKTEKALRDTLPGWGENTLGELADYLGKVGLNPQNATDAYVNKGLWEIAAKAKAYDALQAEKAKLTPTSKLAKVTKPQASNPTNRDQIRRTEAFKRHASKGTLDTLADLL